VNRVTRESVVAREKAGVGSAGVWGVRVDVDREEKGCRRGTAKHHSTTTCARDNVVGNPPVPEDDRV